MGKFILLLLLNLFFLSNLRSANSVWIWLGSLSNDFGTKQNWQTSDNNHRPGNGDTVIINKTSTWPLLDRNYTINDLRINGGKLVLNNYDLKIVNEFNFDSGTVQLDGETFNINILNLKNGIFNSISVSNLEISVFNFNNSNVYSFDNNTEVSVFNSLNFVNGKIKGGYGNCITFKNNAISAGFGTNKYIVSSVCKEGNDSFLFPIGSDSFYAPIAISAPSTTASKFIAKYYKEPFSNTDSLKYGLSNVSKSEYWKIDRLNGNSQVYLYLYWNLNRSGISQDSNSIRICHWDSISSKWEGLGGIAIGTINGQRKHRSLQKVNSFSPFTLGSSNQLNPLSFRFIDVGHRKVEKDSFELFWTYELGERETTFKIEMYDSKIEQWIAIGVTKSNGGNYYLFPFKIEAINKNMGPFFLRIVALTDDGLVKFSNIIKVSDDYFILYNLCYPNPVNSFLNFCASDLDEISEIALNSIDGKTFVKKLTNSENNCAQIDVSDLEDGFYFFVVNNRRFRIIKY